MSAVDYKNTLHLPQTSFPMKAELAKREPQFLTAWNEAKLYQHIQEARKDEPVFILHDGPPYANGTLHVGHAANKILKDIIVKTKVLCKMRAPFIPGWDCHGLPIELVVEKKFGKVGTKLNAAEFRAECRRYAASQIEQQREDFKRLGVLADWENPYITMDSHYEANEIRILADIYANGYIKRGYKPVHWCLDCGSSLAEAEVEYQDKVSDSITVKFQVCATPITESFFSNISIKPEHIFLLIWTTTPWTLPANQAIAAGEDITYALVKMEGEYYIVAEALLETVFDQTMSVIKRYQGKEFSEIDVVHPLTVTKRPIVFGAHVTTDVGTGFVHTAPAHGVEDYQIGQKYKLPVFSPLEKNGCFAENTFPEALAGKHVTKANPIIIQLLEDKDRLFNHKKIKHSYPHCWRHKTPLIFRATPQWFISMEHLEREALKAAYSVKFVPPEGKNRFLSMLEGRPDWCISRQRTWGVPLPFFTHKVTHELHPDTEKLLHLVADAIKERGLEAWFGASTEDFGVDGTLYDKATDTLDVWFDSGSSNQCVLMHRPELSFPADLYLEGSDQHRAWFQVSLLNSVATIGKKPYRQILTHGFLVDGEGRKMSKSLGNVVTIRDAVQEYGADILRLWVALTDYTGEMAFSKTIMQQSIDMYRKIRNTLRYLLAALHGHTPLTALSPQNLIAIDAFMMELAAELQEKVKNSLEHYKIRDAMTDLYLFCENDLSNVYFDVLKDRLYTENAVNRHSAQTALYHILNALVRMILPVLSFTADEVWQLLREKNGVRETTPFIAEWYPMPALKPTYLNVTTWNLLKRIRTGLNRELDLLRKDKKIGANLDVAVNFYCAPDMQVLLEPMHAELHYFFITSAIHILPESAIDMQADHPQILKKQVELPDCKGLKMDIIKTAAQKCSRCWHHREEVQVRPDLVDNETQAICTRCYDNLTESENQKRHYF